MLTDLAPAGLSGLAQHRSGSLATFIIAGQSNASGRGTHAQLYSGAVRSYLFGNDYVFRYLTDPTDSVTGQVDNVSSEGAGEGGSVWPLVASLYASARGVGCIMVPCAKGGTAIADWQPGVDHEDRATLYGSMVHRARWIGATCVLWWQGERDALIGTSQASYAANLQALGDALRADLGVPLVACKLQNNSAPYAAGQGAINAAIGATWGTHNVIPGPDLSVITTAPEEAVHLITDAKLAQAAGLWWQALRAAFGW